MQKVKMRLKAGDFDGFKNGNRHTYQQGDLVELTSQQVECFGDKFEDPRVQDEIVAKAAKEKVIRERLEQEESDAAAAEAQKIQDDAKKLLALEEQATKLSDAELNKHLKESKDEVTIQVLTAEAVRRKEGK